MQKMRKSDIVITHDELENIVTCPNCKGSGIITFGTYEKTAHRMKIMSCWYCEGFGVYDKREKNEIH